MRFDTAAWKVWLEDRALGAGKSGPNNGQFDFA